jgi:hypothetical protein
MRARLAAARVAARAGRGSFAPSSPRRRCRGSAVRRRSVGNPYLKGAVVVVTLGWRATRPGARVRVVAMRAAARPYLGEPGGGAGGRIGVVAAAHSSVGSARRAGGYQELAASLSVRWGLVSHRAERSRPQAASCSSSCRTW